MVKEPGGRMMGVKVGGDVESFEEVVVGAGLVEFLVDGAFEGSVFESRKALLLDEVAKDLESCRNVEEDHGISGGSGLERSSTTFDLGIGIGFGCSRVFEKVPNVSIGAPPKRPDDAGLDSMFEARGLS